MVGNAKLLKVRGRSDLCFTTAEADATMSDTQAPMLQPFGRLEEQMEASDADALGFNRHAESCHVQSRRLPNCGQSPETTVDLKTGRLRAPRPQCALLAEASC